MPVSRRPEPLQPATSGLESDAKGQHAVRALIALLTSSFGREASATARCWAGRIAVTQHITGSSARESRIRARGRRKGHADLGVASGRPLGWVKAVTGDRLVASWTVAREFGASGAVCPSGEWCGRAGVVRFVRLMHRRGRAFGPA